MSYKSNGLWIEDSNGTNDRWIGDVVANHENTLNSGSSPAFIYKPVGWNANFLSKLPNAKVAVVADSIGRGYFSSDLTAKGWVQLLTADLQTTYGDGGSGYKTSTDCTAFANAASIPAGAQTRYAARGYNTQAGVWTRDTASFEGPGGGTAMTTIDNSAPGSMTFLVRGTTIKIFTKSAGGANAAWQYKIDGGGAVGVADGAGTNIQVTTVTGLTVGNHTVQVLYNDAGVKTLWLLGVAGENATGLIVNNLSIFGAQSTGPGQFTPFTDGSLTPDWMGGYKYPADLAIYGLGVNDANVSTAADTYTQMVRRWLMHVRDGGATPLYGDTSLLVVAPHIGSYDSTTRIYQDYLARLRGICEAYGAALIDFWGLGKNSYNYWSLLNYWGNPSDPTTFGSDNIHPSDLGHAYMSSIIKPILLTAV